MSFYDSDLAAENFAYQNPALAQAAQEAVEHMEAQELVPVRDILKKAFHQIEAIDCDSKRYYELLDGLDTLIAKASSYLERNGAL